MSEKQERVCPGCGKPITDQQGHTIWSDGTWTHVGCELAPKRQWWKGGSKETWAPGEEVTPMKRDGISLDPVFQMTTGWYFCEETWSECYGPMATEAECRTELDKYCHQLEHGPADPTTTRSEHE